MIVFLDMDGVLVDFAQGVASLFGIEKSAVDANGSEAYEAAGVPREEFWRRIESAGRGWWETLPPYPWAQRLVSACEGVGDVYVATSPPTGSVSAASGKMAWLRDTLPKVYSGRRFFIGTHKYLLAGPGRVLVDDDVRKRDAFADAGGLAVLFPRPWNAAHLPPAADPWKLIEGIETNGDFDGHLR